MNYSIQSNIARPGEVIATQVELTGTISDQIQPQKQVYDETKSSPTKITGVATSIVGKSAWEYARDGGYPGTEEQFAADLARIHNTIELENIYKLPTIGNPRTLYVISDEGASYVWLEDALRYVCVGRDYEKVTVINGNK